MRIYRAVSSTELEDIRSLQGRLRDSPHRSGKGFFFEREDAILFGMRAKAYDSARYFVICMDAPEEVIRRGIPHIAACEGPGVYLRDEDLALLTGPCEEASVE
jgi:hypothetical protein